MPLPDPFGMYVNVYPPGLRRIDLELAYEQVWVDGGIRRLEGLLAKYAEFQRLYPEDQA